MAIVSPIPGVPPRIPIARVENDRTHWLGSAADGRQFMGFVESAIRGPSPSNDAALKRWYAALHLFDRDGGYLNSRIEFTSEWTPWRALGREGVDRAEKILAAWHAELAPIRFGDIAVALFSTEKEGVKFALEASQNDDGSPRVDLWPNDLYFCAPWDGSYDT